MDKTVIVIPCYNEAGRLREDEYNLLLQKPGLELLFVNDGSQDQTERQIQTYIQKTGYRVRLLNLNVNSGKAEAVRLGMLRGMQSGPSVIGFIDADMATPASDVLRLLNEAIKKEYLIILGSRVRLLGTEIKRHTLRHYVGRVFATFASVILNLPVYDTQCGAKFFAVTPLLKDVLADPFSSRWVFDVELIGRLIIGSKTSPPVTVCDFIEVPLKKWMDVHGSKISPTDAIKVPAEMMRIAWQLRKRRRSLRI